MRKTTKKLRQSCIKRWSSLIDTSPYTILFCSTSSQIPSSTTLLHSSRIDTNGRLLLVMNLAPESTPPQHSRMAHPKQHLVVGLHTQKPLLLHTHQVIHPAILPLPKEALPPSRDPVFLGKLKPQLHLNIPVAKTRLSCTNLPLQIILK